MIFLILIFQICLINASDRGFQPQFGEWSVKSGVSGGGTSASNSTLHTGDNVPEHTPNSNNTFLLKGAITPFEGWLVKEYRIKELLAIEINYTKNLELITSYKDLSLLYDKKINLFEKDRLLSDEILKAEREKIDILEKDRDRLKKQSTIWITTSIVCISISVSVVGGIIVYAVLSNIK